MSQDQWDIRFVDDHRSYTKLRYAVWPKGRIAKRYVVFSNGRTEWIEKYSSVPEWLQLPEDTGFLAWDHCGQGGSGGDRSWIDSYDSYSRDAQKILNLVVAKRPYTVIAHSMGSLIALYATLRGILSPERLVLCSPLLQLPNKPLPEFIGRPVAKILSYTKWSKSGTGAGKHDRAQFDNNKLTHDEEAFKRIQNTPYPAPSASFGWVNQTYKATDFCRSKTALLEFKTPTLILAGEDERVVDPKGFDLWISQARKFSRAKIDYKVIAKARHELFSEIPEIRGQAINAIREWARI